MEQSKLPKYKFAILKNETEDNHIPWVTACENFSELIDYEIIDLTKDNWLNNIEDRQFDFLLTRPADKTSYFKQLYDERIFILHKILGYNIYPTFNELLIYENKKFLSYYLKARNIPHPKTWVFYHKEDAVQFVNTANFPIVAKTSIGSSGSGVEIFRSKQKAVEYIERAFSSAGIKRSYLPNFRKGDYLNRIKRRLKNISEAVDYFKEKKEMATKEPQKWFVIFQEYIETEFEWRCVVIDDSYFGHKKLRTYGEKLSGTSKVSWDYPDEQLLFFLKRIMDENKFWSQSIDLFYDKIRGYLVNELQCFWGSKNPHQMIKDGVPGRFFFDGDKWIFEEGEFNTDNSYNLRVKHILKLLKERNA